MGIRDSLLKKRQPVERDVGADEPVFIKVFSGKDRAHYVSMNEEFQNQKDETGKTGQKSNALIVAMSVVNKDGSPVFSENELDEILTIDGTIIDSIVSASLDVNGLSENSQGDIEKN